ncbi:MAG: GreA/GreB family elongation factor [Actinomycetota bacterium]
MKGGDVMVANGDRPIERPLTGRLHELESDLIPELERQLAGDGDLAVEASLGAARREAEDIRDALERARQSQDAPWDEQQIEVGDEVEVREPGVGPAERYVLVWGGPGARIEEGWISDRSPLGSALIGSRRGEVVVVDAPMGPVRYEIVDFQRAG